jgi:hypothetical protein
VDSEDIPLNLSREHLQGLLEGGIPQKELTPHLDSALISRLSSVLTRRILKFLYDESKNEEYLGEYLFLFHFLTCLSFKVKL